MELTNGDFAKQWLILTHYDGASLFFGFQSLTYSSLMSKNDNVDHALKLFLGIKGMYIYIPCVNVCLFNGVHRLVIRNQLGEGNGREGAGARARMPIGIVARHWFGRASDDDDSI